MEFQIYFFQIHSTILVLIVEDLKDDFKVNIPAHILHLCVNIY